jgi:hypothetical protein
LSWARAILISHYSSDVKKIYYEHSYLRKQEIVRNRLEKMPFFRRPAAASSLLDIVQE